MVAELQRVLLALVMAVPLAAQDPVAPEPARAAARAALDDTARGSALRVELITIGQGDLVFERYGHNLLRITDERTGESTAWGWGNFDFDEPGFLVRFLFGKNQYRIEGVDAQAMLNYYARTNRPVETQLLALSPGQRAALDALVRVNVMPGNESYRYDYFLDNCSTRLRDALDIVLGGAVRAVLAGEQTALTYRDETLRLNQHDAVLFLGLDLALGAPSDRALTSWEAAFIPMRLRDGLQRVQVPSPDGGTIPLAGPPRLLIDAEREAEPAVIDSRAVRATTIVIAVAITIVVIGLGRAARRGSRGARRGVAAMGFTVHLVLGLLASLLLFMWLFTLHAFWAWNLHLILFTPLSLAAAMLFLRARARARRLLLVYHIVMSVLAFCVGVAALSGLLPGTRAAADMLVAWSSALWLVYAALAIASTWTMTPEESVAPRPGAAAMRAVA